MKLFKNTTSLLLAVASAAVFLGSVTLFSSCKHMDSDMQSSASPHKYTCSMHPEVVSDSAGKCPKCGMELTEKK